jgi:hypothetical protein
VAPTVEPAKPVRVKPAARVPLHIPRVEPEPTKERRRRPTAAIAAAVLVLLGGFAGLLIGIMVVNGVPLMRHQSAGRDIGASAPNARVGFPASVPSYGTLLDARVNGSGDVLTDEWISLRVPITTLAMRSQPLSAGDNRFAPAIRDLSVTADGHVVPVSGRTIFAKTVTVRLPRLARYLHLHYRVSGVAQTNRRAPSGRALVLTNGLAVRGVSGAVPQTLRLSGADVLQVSCEYRATPPSPCGVQHGHRWTVTAKGRATSQRVVAQLDLRTSGRAGVR